MIVLNGFWQVFAGGMIGVAVVELLKVVAWLNTGKLQRNYRKLMYWIAISAFLLLAGLSSVWDGVDHVPLKRAIQLGINAPAILGGVATAARYNKGQKKQRAAAFMGAMQEEPDQPSLWTRLVTAIAWV